MLLAVLAPVIVGMRTAHPAPADPAPASTTGREAATRAQLAAVRAAIAAIASAQHATAAKRDAINARLADQARQLNEAAIALRDTDAAILARTTAIANLEQQRGQLQTRLSGQREALASLLRAVYTLDRGPGLSLVLGDDDIARTDRALGYSLYFQRDRVARIRALLDDMARLGRLGDAIAAETRALQQQRDQRVAQSAQLEQSRDAQQQLLANADAQLADQKDKLAALQRDAKALDTLLKQLQDVFSDIPRQLGKQTPFAQLRGKLPAPVAGNMRAGTGTLANGVVIAARPGAEVHAVAYGRVAWADFMRGFGMLVIIDHGDGWMSLYGGNEAALVAAGDWVKPGQPIATVGRNPEQGGAWFGLRRHGQPVSPRGWFGGVR